ncbi:MAG: helix-turn-helix transcriptional regulator [Treponema sp.]|nr:helix-turn-helix transcriptional regulator [Treponema sp.]
MEKEIVRYPRIQGVSFTQGGTLGSFPQHWHNAAEFHLALKDGATYKIDGSTYRTEEGDILLIWPRELHEVVYCPKDGVDFIQFSSYLIESNSDFAAASHFLTECHLIRKKDNPALTEKISDLIFKIRDMHEQNNYFSVTRCKLLIYEFLLAIGDCILSERRENLRDEGFTDKLLGYIRFACSYITEHSAENITQAEVAEKTGLSQFYFSKLFNEYTKMSFPTFLAQIRVQSAINLLENESLSVTDCAFESGFQSTTTFNKIFHEITGCTPREYRKMHSRNHRQE